MEALREIHVALATYPGRLPSFTVAIDSCRRLLQEGTALPALPARDKDFLLVEHDRLRMLLAAAAVTPVPVHGDPHLGNVLITSSGPLWTDWEPACVGPLEWDHSCLPGTSAVSPIVDQEMLALLRDLRSVCVAVWCWADPDRAPEKREAAEFHLHRLRERSRSARRSA